jgi:hypothetical protein
MLKVVAMVWGNSTHTRLRPATSAFLQASSCALLAGAVPLVLIAPWQDIVAARGALRQLFCSSASLMPHVTPLPCSAASIERNGDDTISYPGSS